ncbi:hypothetical protein BOX15_Mlig000701g2 [Macrostomum lignano]|uniref:FHA domain-containing protein n=1 Tax=Macrostomum lignano TaxID=282301 RepID=A0A267EJH3_9PLAT|nr:hypothetical protein BOX15_Mlig000701g2 [Macrostomum lignano]
MTSHLNKKEKSELSEKLFNNFKVPSWAGRPQMGLHLDVLKEGKLVQKLMIDEKKCYFFGRNRQLCDFPVEHESCSRVHAALVWHKFVSRPFLIDLGSTHGTFIGTFRLEPHKPQQVPIDSEIHFGASSRVHIIREKPQHRQRYLEGGEGEQGADQDGVSGNGTSGGAGSGGISSSYGGGGREGNYLGLPQTESELDNLTEFNTAQNRRIASVVAASVTAAAQNQDPDSVDEMGAIANSRKRRRGRCITFADEDDVINPEDVDPTVGRFRNLVYETFIPNSGKKTKFAVGSQDDSHGHNQLHYHQQSHSADEDSIATNATSASSGIGGDSLSASALSLGAFSAAAKLGLALPNLTPDVDVEPPPVASTTASVATSSAVPVINNNTAPNAGKTAGSPAVVAAGSDEAHEAGTAAASSAGEALDTPRKKKYAKEAWPGKKPGFLASG